MCVPFKIRITRDIIEQCKDCGAENNQYDIGRNCAIAVALQDIFPDVYVTNYFIFPFGIEDEKRKDVKISLPVIARQFIKLFDGFYPVPNLRLLLPEFEFSIDIPDEVIDAISIDGINGQIQSSKKSRHIIQTSYAVL